MSENDEEFDNFGLSIADLRGNDHADKMANDAAVKYRVDMNASSSVSHYSALVRRIQKRFVRIIHCHLYTAPSPRDRTRSRMPSSARKKKLSHIQKPEPTRPY